MKIISMKCIEKIYRKEGVPEMAILCAQINISCPKKKQWQDEGNLNKMLIALVKVSKRKIVSIFENRW